MTVDYSIVIPVYFNEGSLSLTMTAIQQEVIKQNPELGCEIIFVDDGSGDGSLEELLVLHSQHPSVIKVVKLTRNFGQVNAIMAGLSLVKGKCVVVMSADNQDPPVLINQMLQAYFGEGYEIVICMREGRDEPYLTVWASRLSYALMRKLSFPNMPSGGFDFVLLSKRVVSVLLRNWDATPFFQGQILWTGFKTKFIGYSRHRRQIGQSRWTFGRKLTYLIDGVVSYSFLPIRLISGLGAVVATLGFLYAVIILVTKLVWGLPTQGWAPLMIVILVLGGFQMLMLGIIGEYVWRTLAQVRNRDHFIVEQIWPSTTE